MKSLRTLNLKKIAAISNNEIGNELSLMGKPDFEQFATAPDLFWLTLVEALRKNTSLEKFCFEQLDAVTMEMIITTLLTYPKNIKKVVLHNLELSTVEKFLPFLSIDNKIIELEISELSEKARQLIRETLFQNTFCTIKLIDNTQRNTADQFSRHSKIILAELAMNLALLLFLKI